MCNGRHAGWIVLLVPACFHPSYDRPLCSVNGECPSGLKCSEQLVCEVALLDARAADAPIDNARVCLGSYVEVCVSSPPTMPLIINLIDSNLDINTDIGASASPLCDPLIAEYCVVARTSFSVATGKKIRAHGTRPLILMSTTSTMFDLSGDIDVSSSQDGTLIGAGAYTAAMCRNVSNPPVSATENSGGFGGSFAGRGGDGEKTDGEKGAASPATSFPAILRGGCPGGAGGAGGAGGNGGGAVDIIATSIRIDGKINASGAGGRGGPAVKSGGGGGGSGGMIVLDVPAAAIIRGTGILYANGGGGAEGGAGPSGAFAGQDGQAPAGPTPAAAGGNGGHDGGNGGAGSAGIDDAGVPGGQSRMDGGGGAGGGAAGFIYAPGFAGDAIISPPSTDVLPR